MDSSCHVSIMDLIIKGGKLIDGRGDRVPYYPWVSADLGIEEGKIVEIGDLHRTTAEKTIDAQGMVVCPGFIDIHSHSDVTLLLNPKAESKVRQGVTTEVLGSCGESAYPLAGIEARKQLESRSPNLQSYGLSVEWKTLSEYADVIVKRGVACNVVPITGHVPVRLSVMGWEKRRPTETELEQMKSLVEETMLQGSFGFSTGLIYSPSSFADIDEIADLCRVAAKHGGIYKTHMRGGGGRVIEALKETLEIGRRSGIHVHVHHHKAMGDQNAAKVKITLPMIEESISAGVHVTVDMYPYMAGQGNLNAALPPWIHEGGPKELASRLKERDVRERLKKEMVEPESVPQWESYVEQSGWETCWSGWRIVSCTKEKNKKFEGKSIAEAKPEWQDPFEFLFDLLADEDGSVPFILPDVGKVGEEFLHMMMRHPVMMVGSDGYALAPYGPLGAGMPHPRSYGTFPRVLGRYVRDLRVLSLGEAIRKMTFLPATTLGLTDRGVIEEGKVADLVVFDPATVADCATYASPHSYPIGIVHVLVNGKLVIENSEHTEALPGRVLRSTDYKR